MKIQKAHSVSGTLSVPGDKSLSHRALIFSAIAKGTSHIDNLGPGKDVANTENCLRQLGVQISGNQHARTILGKGMPAFSVPNSPLDCGNSGTTIRLLMGLLGSLGIECELTGDSSLTKRPMKRIGSPLRSMGVTLQLQDGNYAPISIQPLRGKLKPLNYALPVASAQLKSALLLAALQANGKTTLSGRIDSRDHTERLLQYYGVSIELSKDEISVQGPQELKSQDWTVPGDPSSAAFWLAAAALLPNSQIEISDVLLNPTRIAFVDALKRMGAQIKWEQSGDQPEPVGTLLSSSGKLVGIEISPNEIPHLVDEIPILSVLAAFADGTTTIRGAEELRLKETDRLMAIEKNLLKMGAQVESFEDGLKITGKPSLKGARFDSFDDHRIAMAFTIAGLRAEGTSQIDDHCCVSISYPNFFEDLQRLING